jgi:hypothetical protein
MNYVQYSTVQSAQEAIQRLGERFDFRGNNNHLFVQLKVVLEMSVPAVLGYWDIMKTFSQFLLFLPLVATPVSNIPLGNYVFLSQMSNFLEIVQIYT